LGVRQSRQAGHGTPCPAAELGDREQDIVESLLAIADLCNFGDFARESICELLAKCDTSEKSEGTELLKDIREVFATACGEYPEDERVLRTEALLLFSIRGKIGRGPRSATANRCTHGDSRNYSRRMA